MKEDWQAVKELKGGYPDKAKQTRTLTKVTKRSFAALKRPHVLCSREKSTRWLRSAWNPMATLQDLERIVELRRRNQVRDGWGLGGQWLFAWGFQKLLGVLKNIYHYLLLSLLSLLSSLLLLSLLLLYVVILISFFFFFF